MEIWKAIEGYEGFYEVSNKGTVRSLPRNRIVKNRYGGQSARTDKGKEIVATDNGNGYLLVSLRKNGARENHYVHRLVASAFCENSGNKETVNHKDHDRKNNNAENLEWVTQKENVRYSSEIMRKPKSRCKTSSTGEKYIHLYHRKGRKEVYRLTIRQMNVEMTFKTLEEAVQYRNEVMRSGE